VWLELRLCARGYVFVCERIRICVHEDMCVRSSVCVCVRCVFDSGCACRMSESERVNESSVRGDRVVRTVLACERICVCV